ncbi:hypothetical protein [Cryptosporangium sp. NPDC051539]|uniref:hypothetical protein n=1 Tax=Cryptosporangium sp. NPDC051539 TaxID=3363962 RepID=UPI00378D35C2
MTAVNRSKPPKMVDEQLIGALIPAVQPAPVTQSPPLPGLAPLVLPVASWSDLLLDLARVDRSGRLSSRGLMGALGWPAGHRLAIDAVGGAVVAGSSLTGPCVVGSRGDLAIPAAVRGMCGIEVGAQVVLVAAVTEERLVAHSASTVLRLIAGHHARSATEDDDDD